MGKVKVPNLQVGSSITSTDINTFILSVRGLEGTINDENVRLEGIDKRNIALRNVQDTTKSSSEHYFSSGSSFSVIQTQNVFVPLVQSLQIGPITCENDDKVLIHCSFAFFLKEHSSLGVPNITLAPEVRFRLGYQDTFAQTAGEVIRSERRYSSVLASNNQYVTLRDTCTIVSVYRPETTTGTNAGKNRLFFTLEGFSDYSQSAGPTKNLDAKVVQAQLFARVIKR
tara:strand:+ start:2175 stop:2855 length:681 start_codon:yes stop_codon:yes gene_type:complete